MRSGGKIRANKRGQWGACALGELNVTTAHSKDDQMALPQDAFLGNGAGHAAGSNHALCRR